MVDNVRFNQILIDYCAKEVHVTPVDKQACEDRHEAETMLREEKAKLLVAHADAAVKAVETRIRIWLLTIGLAILASSIATMVGTFIKIGVTQERIDQNSAQHEKYDEYNKHFDGLLREQQKQIDMIQWTMSRGGAP